LNSHPLTSPKTLPFELLLKEEQIRKRVAEMGREIAADYAGKSPVFVGVMKGCMIFLADLIRHINIPLEVEFISTSWYRKGTAQAGKVVLSGTFNAELRGRHVLIVEGIIDSGRTVNAILDHIRSLEPATIELVTLLDKPGSHRKSVNAKYKGFSIGNEFVIGYGLDNTQKYRNLPYIGKVIEEK
jgi:hypoxanthine phosphoribosyltransferase